MRSAAPATSGKRLRNASVPASAVSTPTAMSAARTGVGSVLAALAVLKTPGLPGWTSWPPSESVGALPPAARSVALASAFASAADGPAVPPPLPPLLLGPAPDIAPFELLLLWLLLPEAWTSAWLITSRQF